MHSVPAQSGHAHSNNDDTSSSFEIQVDDGASAFARGCVARVGCGLVMLATGGSLIICSYVPRFDLTFFSRQCMGVFHGHVKDFWGHVKYGVLVREVLGFLLVGVMALLARAYSIPRRVSQSGEGGQI